MSMLAEPRRKQKISADPRNLAWKNDESKFGQKLMEKMGWSCGTGLGAKGTGNIEPIKVQLKADTRGVGCTRNHADNWIAHQDDFDSLLASLNADSCGSQGGGPVQKLEEKSKKAKGRVHYMKFAKGKDLSMKTATDLDCIFGKRKSKSAPVTPQTQSVVNSDGDEDSTEGEKRPTEKAEDVLTFTSKSSVQDYFASKMAALKKLRSRGEASSPPRVVDYQEGVPGTVLGYQPAPSVDGGSLCDPAGETTETTDVVLTEERPKKKKKKDKKRKEIMEEKGELGEEDEIVEKCDLVEAKMAVEVEDVEKSSKKKKKRKRECNEELKDKESEDSSSINNNNNNNKRQRKRENEAIVQEESTQDISCKKKKKRKKERALRKNEQEDDAELSAPVDSEEGGKNDDTRALPGGTAGADEQSTGEGEEEGMRKKRKLGRRSNASEDPTTVEILERLERGTRPVVMTRVLPGEAKGGTVINWARNVESADDKDNGGFVGSNFGHIVGYGHGFDPKLVLMPISQKYAQKIEAWKMGKMI